MKILLISLLIVPSILLAKDISSHDSGIWSLTATDKMKRWVVIHNLKEGSKSGVYHIEVIGRSNGHAIWQIQRIVTHMAITEQALSKSVVKPLKNGAVYPESFNNAYAKWKEINSGKARNICTTTVIECM